MIEPFFAVVSDHVAHGFGCCFAVSNNAIRSQSSTASAELSCKNNLSYHTSINIKNLRVLFKVLVFFLWIIEKGQYFLVFFSIDYPFVLCDAVGSAAGHSLTLHSSD
jgi:hypothetical protein